MISKDLDIEIVEFLVNDYLETGWKYTYWGKKIFTNKKDTKEEFLEFVSIELELEDYETFIDEDIVKNIDEFISGKKYYCCLFIDKHDGDGYGVGIYTEEEGKNIIENAIEILLKLKDMMER